MVYFCADDYGISPEGNKHIENCLKDGALNKVSVLPNGEIGNFKTNLAGKGALLSLHLNLIEGYPLSPPSEVKLLINKSGSFRHSFVGLLLLSLSNKRKEFEKQLYKEIQSQIKFWKTAMGEDIPLSIDSHQHTHMIPLIFKTLLRVISDENVRVSGLRIPSEPITPYIFAPSLYILYTPKRIVKQWLLKILGAICTKNLKNGTM